MPRAGLTPPRVVDAASVLVDRVGWPHLTMSALADELGVRQPSLYKHVDGMPALQRALAVQAKRDLARTMATAAVGRSGAQAVRSVGHAYRDWARAHPGLYPAVLRPPTEGDEVDAQASASAAEVVFEVLAGYGLTGDAAVHMTRALRSGLHGFVDLEANGGFGIPVAVDSSFEAMLSGFVRALEASGRLE